MHLKELKPFVKNVAYFHIVVENPEGGTTIATCDTLDRVADKKWLDYEVQSFKPIAYRFNQETMSELEIRIRKGK